MSGLPDHHCPGCGMALKGYARYPWYFCVQCIDALTDADGRRLVCANTNIAGGGFAYRYADETDDAFQECGGLVAYIRGRPVYVAEAYMGGVVAQPLQWLSADAEHTVDLRTKLERHLNPLRRMDRPPDSKPGNRYAE